ncbi:hypothetical protein AOLI_G00232910 [Acnodon oligacanthus]
MEDGAQTTGVFLELHLLYDSDTSCTKSVGTDLSMDDIRTLQAEVWKLRDAVAVLEGKLSQRAETLSEEVVEDVPILCSVCKVKLNHTEAQNSELTAGDQSSVHEEEEEDVSSVNPGCKTEEWSVFIPDCVGQSEQQDPEQDGGSLSLECHTDPNPTDCVDSSCTTAAQTPLKMCSVRLEDCRTMMELSGRSDGDGSDHEDDDFVPSGDDENWSPLSEDNRRKNRIQAEHWSHRSGGLQASDEVHSGEKLFTCLQCEKRFATSRSLAMHVKRHKKNLHCEECGKGFVTRKELKLHVTRHTGATEFTSVPTDLVQIVSESYSRWRSRKTSSSSIDLLSVLHRAEDLQHRLRTLRSCGGSSLPAAPRPRGRAVSGRCARVFFGLFVNNRAISGRTGRRRQSGPASSTLEDEEVDNRSSRNEDTQACKFRLKLSKLLVSDCNTPSEMEEEPSLTLHCYNDPDPEDTPDQQSAWDGQQDGSGAQPEGEPEPENVEEEEEEEDVSSVNPECKTEEWSVFIPDCVGQSEQQDVEQDGGSLSLECLTDPNPTERVDSSCTAAAQTPLKTCSVRLEDCRGTLTGDVHHRKDGEVGGAAEDCDLTPPGSGDKVPPEEHTEEPLHPCSDCGETFTSRDLLSCHQRTHTAASDQGTFRRENTHCTVLKSEDPPVPQRCSRCCVKFHCPFCPPAVYKPRHDAYSVNKHLQCHLKHAVRQRGYIICMCHLGCRPRGHFHCPICGSTVIRKDDAQSHISSCRVFEAPSEERLHPCFDCGETFKTKYHLSFHLKTHTGEKPQASVQGTHSGENRHCTVLKSEDPPVPQRCSRCCVKFHCPFCPPAVYKPRHDAYSVNKHLQCHLKHAVRQRGYIICMCHLGCRPRGHFHCPICGSTVIRKDDAQSHISSCRGDGVKPPSEGRAGETPHLCAHSDKQDILIVVCEQR